MKTISIVGAGGHTRSSVNLLKQNFSDCNFLIFDDSFDAHVEEFIHDIKVVGKECNIPKESLLFLSIGNNSEREKLFNKFKKQVITKNLFHKSAIVEDSLTIGISNQIFANVYINSHVEISDNNIINSSAILEHEVKLGSHNHISVGSKLCGRVKVGNNCFIGAGSIVIDKISICDDVIVGAGSVVVKDIVEAGTYVGNPAKRIK